MRRYFILPLALLFIALGVPSNAQMGAVGAAGAAGEGSERRVVVAAGAALEVRCALGVHKVAEWRLDGGPLPPDLRRELERPPPDGPTVLTARLLADRARTHHAGLYTCSDPPLERVRLVVTAPSAGETTTVGASADELAAPPGPADEPTYYDVGRPFALNCTLPVASGSTAYVWRKNGTAVEQVPALLKRYSLEEGGAVLRLAGRTTEDDYGNYSCELAGAQLAFDVRGHPHAKLQHNLNVVEKQPLKITCKMIGKPYPAVSWTFTNESHNGTAVEEALGAGRVTLRRSEQGVERGELALEAAERSDAGVYTCVPARGTPAETTLRVKDQFAALWPFLGICAEVFVLCAIILVYERRRTKPELDDSDTDNHEQKKS